jgi:hypothetical protein
MTALKKDKKQDQPRDSPLEAEEASGANPIPDIQK